jgi:SanA protein
MFKRLMRFVLKLAVALGIAAAIILLLPRLITLFYAQSRLYTIPAAPSKNVAVVFGAGIWRNNRPTAVLRDRVDTAAELYFTGKVEKLLMSGANPSIYYNEPEVMRSYALELGIPEEAIVMDYAGLSTYDTCYRMRDIFGVKDVILVTQRFHLPRALFICQALGIQAIGVPADRRTYRPASNVYWNLRELFATLNAFWEVYFSRPQPILGEVEPIYPAEVY